MDPREGLAKELPGEDGQAMTPERHAHAKQIFLGAIQLPPDQRGPWLDKACAGDPSLRSEVESLLAQISAESPEPNRPLTAPSENRLGSVSKVTFEAQDSSAAQSVPVRSAPDPHPNKDILSERPPGTMIAGRYRMVSRLGRGGMGIVYRADDLTLNQTVAIKFLPPALATNPIWLVRLRNEAKLARTVTHPNVCRVHDVGQADGEHFITMEFVAGEDLASLLRRIGRLTIEKALDIGRQICFGLTAAHRAGVLHRDLKPANIMLDAEGNARITDFGIAGLMGQIAPREIRAGTPAYMAPEQIAGRDVTLQSDLYALGLVLYELFSGCRAYQANSLDEYLRLHETAAPTPLSEIVADLPEGIEAVIDQCLQKDPTQRPRSALHVAAALPGTDVLRLALASDVTPSPDLIAAAPARKGGYFNQTRLMIGAVTLLALVVLLRSVHPVQWDDLGTSPPPALAERARSVLETAGLTMMNAYEAFGYCVTQDAWQPMSHRFNGEDLAVQVKPDTAAEPCFFYRQSDRPLIPTTMENVFWRAGYVTPWDPPLADADSRIVLFDKAGRLILSSVAIQSSQQPQRAATDPTVFSKQRRVVITAQRVLFLSLLAIAVPFGISKFRRSNVDYHGAVRLAVLVALMEVVESVLRLGSTATFDDGLSRLCMAVVRAAGIAGLLGMFYLAVDAYARRLWPHLLVTWNRLLLGRFGDHDVRFHTLVGVCVGCWWAFVKSAEWTMVSAAGLDVRPMFAGERIAEKLHGFASVLASYFGCAEQALVYGLLFLLLLVVIRTWIRHSALAVVVCTLVMVPIFVPRGAHPYTAWLAMGLGGVVVSVWVMVRYGLLAIVVAIFVTLVLNSTPMNISSRVWTVSLSMCAIAILVCLSVYCVLWQRKDARYTPSGGRKSGLTAQ